MATSYVAENAASRRELEQLVSGLTERDLRRETAYGWTVSALLAHLAFWDQRILALLRRWKDQGVDESPIDLEAMNAALLPLCHAIEPRAAVELCLRSAAAADAELEALSDSMVAAIEASGNHFRFNRGLHRLDHLEDIQKLIGE